MARLNSLETITKLEAERDRIEDKISEFEMYDTLKAHGASGSETRFVDITKLHRRLDHLNNRLETLYRHNGL